MKRRFDLYLKDILECIEKIYDYTEGFDYEHFKADSLHVDAVSRNLEIIGEAVSQMQEGDKKKYTQVPWQDIKDFRNVIVHRYRHVDTEIVWNIIKTELEPLKQQVKEILEKER